MPWPNNWRGAIFGLGGMYNAEDLPVEGTKGDKGDKGDPGDDGADSTVPGPPGPTGPASTAPGPTGPPGTTVHSGLSDVTADQHHAKSHAHSGADGSGTVAYADVASKPSTFTPSSHSHPESEVTSLVTDLGAKAASIHTHAESDVTSLVTDLSGKSATGHTHTHAATTGQTADQHHNQLHAAAHATGQADALTAANVGAAAASHAHPESDVTSLVSDLAGKSGTGHTHSGTYDPAGTAASGDSAHAAAGDPHTGYRLESADHTHQSTGLQAGTIAEAALALTDVTTNDASVARHGLLPKLPGGTANFLRADGTFAAPTAQAADPSYSPGSFTVVTETGRFIPARLKLAGSQRATLEGTARLVIT